MRDSVDVVDDQKGCRDVVGKMVVGVCVVDVVVGIVVVGVGGCSNVVVVEGTV